VEILVIRYENYGHTGIFWPPPNSIVRKCRQSRGQVRAG
jgi:hypothetical protein